MLYLTIGSDVVLKFNYAQFTFYQSVQGGEERKQLVLREVQLITFQRLTHKSFSKMHDTSARIKRNFLIKTKIPVCLRSVFIIRFQAHLYACIGHSKYSVCTHFVLSAATLCMAVPEC